MFEITSEIVESFIYCFKISCFVDSASLYNLVNKAKLVQTFSQYVPFFSLQVSGDNVSIIRRNNSIYATFGICHSVRMIVWSAGYLQDSHPHRVTNTKCRIDTVISPDDGHTVARNMQRAPSLLYLQDIFFKFTWWKKFTFSIQNVSQQTKRILTSVMTQHDDIK